MDTRCVSGVRLYIAQHLLTCLSSLRPQAMSIVQDRLNASKPPPSDPKPGKVTAAQLNNNKDLDVDVKKEEPSFFGSFFPGIKGQKKKGGPIMEPVSRFSTAPTVLLTC